MISSSLIYPKPPPPRPLQKETPCSADFSANKQTKKKKKGCGIFDITDFERRTGSPTINKRIHSKTPSETARRHGVPWGHVQKLRRRVLHVTHIFSAITSDCRQALAGNPTGRWRTSFLFEARRPGGRLFCRTHEQKKPARPRSSTRRVLNWSHRTSSP